MNKQSQFVKGSLLLELLFVIVIFSCIVLLAISYDLNLFKVQYDFISKFKVLNVINNVLDENIIFKNRKYNTIKIEKLHKYGFFEIKMKWKNMAGEVKNVKLVSRNQCD